MTEFSQPLHNSTRYINQLTYTPVESSDSRYEPILASRALQKFSLVSSIDITPQEIVSIKSKLPPNDETPSDLAIAIAEIEKVSINSKAIETGAIKVIGKLNSESLIQIAEEVKEIRQHRFKEAVQDAQLLVKDYRERKIDSSIPLPTLSEEPEVIEPIELSDVESASLITDKEPQTIEITQERISDPTILSKVTPKVFDDLQFQDLSIGNALEAYSQDPQHQDIVSRLEKFAVDYQLSLNELTPDDLSNVGVGQVEIPKVAAEVFRKGLKIEPIGYLHLERVAFTPAGEERGELVYTVPLSPKEKVNITHKEWSSTTREYEDLVTDFLEEYSEVGVTEKNELSEAVNTQEQHSSAFNTSATASGEFFGVKFSATVGYSANDSFNQSTNDSIKKTRESTNKASSRVKREHKQSFKVATTTQITDESVRTIENPYADKVMRVDYYRMMRKWKVDLHRYGVRLTYDINIPEPGLELSSKILELRVLDKLLNEDFNTFFKRTSINQHTIESLRRKDSESEIAYQKRIYKLATTYNARIKAPPVQNVLYRQNQIRRWQTEPEWRVLEVVNFEFKFNKAYEVDPRLNKKSHGFHTAKIQVNYIPADGYEKKIAHNQKFLEEWDRAFCQFPVIGTASSVYSISYSNFISDESNFGVTVPILKESDSKFYVSMRKRNLSFISLTVEIELTLKKSEYESWLYITWEKIHEAAQNHFEDYQSRLQQARDKIEEELGDADTLSLRKMEREEVMKNTLRWMFGPGFLYILPGMKEDGLTVIEPGRKPTKISERNSSSFYNKNQAVKHVGKWASILRHGELIKFLHQAIEWENMIYFLYPYFWVDPTEWQDKLYLDHPDPLHKAFLKAGSARVVLPIRPGFEEKFTRFIEEGELAVPSKGEPPPYITIAEEMKNFAKTNYPGIRSANPVQNVRPLLTYKQREAWADMQQLMILLERFKIEMKRYPNLLSDYDLAGFQNEEEREVLVRQEKENASVKKDPWGNEYYYKYPGDYGEYDLASWGANGKREQRETELTNPENADIASWAEASLISTWYEYTPTSALDIDLKI